MCHSFFVLHLYCKSIIKNQLHIHPCLETPLHVPPMQPIISRQTPSIVPFALKILT